MRGQFFHNQILVKRLAGALEKLGAKVRLEHPTRSGQRPRSVDIFAELDGLKLVLEVERESRRALNDLSKAEALEADLLVILVPTRQVARAVLRRLESGVELPNFQIVVLPFGAALQALRENSPLMSLRNVRPTLIQKIPSIPSRHGMEQQKGEL